MPRSSRFALLAALVVVLGALAAADAEDWPIWRGPSGNGISAEKDWSPAAVAKGKVLWRASVGRGFSSFAVADGRAYTIGEADDQDTLFCFDAASGEVLWKRSYPSRKVQYPGPRGTPTVDGGLVYTLSLEGHLYCFDAKSGKGRWKKELPTGVPQWGIASSPMVHGDLVVVNAGTSGTALKKKTGAIVWSGGDGTPGYASPVALKQGSKVSFLVFSKDSLICVSSSGKRRWDFPWTTKYDVNAADPVLVGEKKVFLSSGYGVGCALLEIGARGVRELWRNTNMRNHFTSTIYHDGHLYGFDETILTCLDAKDGAMKWTQRGLGKGGLMIADGKLIVLSERGIHLVIADASPKGFEEIARAKVLDGHTWTGPVLANGRIYCRNDTGDVVCVDAGAEGR